MGIIEVYEIWVWDGGDRHFPKFCFTTEKDAKQYIKDHPHDDYHKKQTKVYYSYEDYQGNTDDAIRKRALAKLTPEEKLVLGVK